MRIDKTRLIEIYILFAHQAVNCLKNEHKVHVTYANEPR